MKKILIKIFGKKFLRYCKTIVIYIIKFPTFVFKNKINGNPNLIKDVNIFSVQNTNTFFGYYDINPLKDNKLLAHSIRKNADTKKEDINIGYFDVNTHEYTYLIKSKAWCWQQGSRLRWSNDENVIIYNDIDNNHYCTRYYDINKKKIIKTISFPLYDINADESYGISVNFSRLQRLRPGYGYDKLLDLTKEDNFPKNDGLFLVDIKNNNSKLLISLYDLAKDVKDYQNYAHYINHVSFSPNGNKVMFFHLYVASDNDEWRTRLCIYDIVKDKLEILEKDAIISHYDWMNNENLLVTTFEFGEEKRDYRIYNLNNKKYKVVDNEKLKKDGHPTFIGNDKFISDTYPDNNYYQHLFEYDMKNNRYNEILSIFSSPRLMDDKRCDLHPRIVKDGIIIDSTFKGNKRSLVFIKLKNGVYDK